MSRRVTVRFRPHQAIMLAAVIAFVGSLPLAGARWYLLPVLLLPLAIAIWAVRSGTDADPAGLRVRALIGQRRIGWSRVAELAADPQGRAVALLTDGERVRLPAVRADDLPRLIAASGQPLAPATPPTPLNPPTPLSPAAPATDATDEPATPPTQ